jgi:hypothetical protein
VTPALVKTLQRTRTTIELTARDSEIGSVVSLKIPAIEVCLAARTWWDDTPSGRECAAERLGLLARAGYLVLLKLRVRPELSLESPIWSWQPGDPTPPFQTISYRARSRWDEPLRWVTAFAASERSGRMLAGRGGRLSHPHQATHDLHLAAIYLRLLKENPAEAAGWVSDRVLAPLRRGKKLPDAEIQDAEGRTLKVIEFGGSYPPERLKKIHEDCESRGVPYELW